MVTIQELQNYLLTEIDSSFTGQVNTWINQMSKYIETETGQEFAEQAEASERVFDGNSKRELLVDKFYELDLVTYKDTPIEVLAYPANKTPQWKLYSEQRFPYGRQNIVVNAKWGYGGAPDDIAFACLIFTAGIIQKQVISKNDKASEKIGDYQVSYTTEAQRDDFNRAMETVKNYKEIAI